MAIKFLNTVAVDTDVLYVDASSNNVGIGTTSPNAKLDIQGTQGQLFSVTDDLSGSIFAVSDISGVPIFDVNSSGVSYFDGNVGIGTTSPNQKLEVSGNSLVTGTQFIGDTFTKIQQASGNLLLTNQSLSGAITFLTNSTEQVRITSSGNVGIGTTSPGRKLQVEGGDFYTNDKSDTAGASVGYGGNSFQIRNGSTSEDLNFDIFNRTTSAWGTPLVIKNTGNVGIGTTDPNRSLHIVGQIALDNSASSPSAGMLISVDSASNKIYSRTANNNSTPLPFEIISGSSSSLYINSNGNVGIGTTSPVTKLHLFNAGYPQMALQSNGGTWQVGVSTGNDLAFRRGTSGSNYPLWLDSSDNVGIGTTSPSEKLEVDGRIKLQTSAGSLIMKESGAGSVALLSSATLGVEAPSNFRVKTGPSLIENFTVLSTGNVGIGTTSPGAPLHVLDDSSTNVLAKIRIQGGSTSGYGDIGMQSGYIRLFSNGSMCSAWTGNVQYNYINGSTATTLNSTGLGIGTTSPSEKLEVAGNARITGDVTLSNGNALRWTSDDVRIEGTTAGDNIKFYVANTEILQLAQSGTLATVTGNLRVTGAYYDSSNSSGTSGQVLSSTATGTDWVSLSEISGVDGTGTAKYLAKWSDTDTITDSVIYDNGTNVGIGTTDFGASSYANWNNLRLGKTGNLFFNTATNTYGFIIGRNFYFASDASYKYLTSDEAETISFGDGNIDFRNATTGTEDGTLTWNTRMRIDSSGNVGIGTTSPTNKLDVNGITTSKGFQTNTTNTNYNLISRNSAGNATLYVQSATSNTNQAIAHFNYGSATANAGTQVLKVAKDISYFTNTNLGIGTTSPSQRAVISGPNTSPSLNTTAVSNASLLISNSDTGYGTYFASTGGGIGLIQQRRQTSAIYYDLALQPYGGNVGIGTTSINNFGFLETVLNISAGSSSSTTLQQAGIVISGSSDADDADDFGYLSFTNYQSAITNDRVAEIRALKNGTNVDTGEFAFYTSSGSGPAERMRIASTGNVGIGTTSPGYKLEINSGTTNVTSAFKSTDNQAWISIQDDDSGTYGALIGIDTDAGNDFVIANQSAQKTFVINSGNVGIGTASPEGKLHVKINDSGATPISQQHLILEHNSATGLGILTPSSTSGYIFFGDENDAQRGYISYSHPTDHMTFKANGAERMRIDSSGNVGIGATSPDAKLDVAGNIKITSALLSNQENTDVDTGAETVAEVSMADYTAAFFDFVIKKGTNVRSGTVYACHDGGSTPVIEFTEISTQDLGDTSDVVLSVDKTGSGGGSKMRLLATTTSDDWSVKSLIRAI